MSEKIVISLDDVRSSEPVAHSSTMTPVPASPSGLRDWGSVAAPSPSASLASAQAGGSFFMRTWVYLGLAALAGAFVAWAVCEPTFYDDRNRSGMGNIFIFPLMLALVCVGLAIAESLVERSYIKALQKGGLSLLLGIIFGFFFCGVANALFNLLLREMAANGEVDPRSPVVWLTRAIAWMTFGVSGGLVYGIVGQSKKKCLYGVMGGVVGAGVGGFVFDPISMMLGGAEVSRMVGMSIFGLSTGIAIGVVESALKDRWLYVASGPLAGKQFILYKPVTSIGSYQANDIYLFKDSSIHPQHARIELRNNQTVLLASGPTLVSGSAVIERLLKSGDVVQIGKYVFHYQEKIANQ